MGQKTIKLSYGINKDIKFLIDKKNLVKVLKINWNKIKRFEDESELIKNSLDNPIVSPKIEQSITTDSKIAIITDDITRPTPSYKILPFIINRILKIQKNLKNTFIIFATGSHRQQTEEERKYLLGSKIYEDIRNFDHDGYNSGNLVDLGVTSRGVPIKVNKEVANADFRICIGLIKPHGEAGYMGGGKSILPGVCGIETIAYNHGYKAVNHSNSKVGVINGNPIRSDIEEAIHKVAPNFILNVILNQNDQIIHVVSGDIIKAHRKGVAFCEQITKVHVRKKADAAIVSCSHPTDINLYQSIASIAAVHRIPKPIVKKGGIIVLCSRCSEGIGHSTFEKLIMKYKDPKQLLDELRKSTSFEIDQWTAQIWADILQTYKIVLVSEGIDEKTTNSIGAIHMRSVQESINYIYREMGSNVKISILSDANEIIPVLKS